MLNQLLKRIASPEFKFVFSSTLFSPEEYESIVNHPPLLDPDGGARRRAAQARKQELQGDDERAKKALQASAEATLDDVPGSGSLQLGGEPEDGRQGSEISGAQDQQRPVLGGQAFPFGQAAAGDALAGLFAQGRSFTPTQQQQQQQFSLLKASDSQTAAQGQHLPANIFQNQSQHLAATGHARQSSRYTFANDTASASAAVKPAANARLMAQQSAMMPVSQNHAPQQYASQYSAAQGPPPGLKSSGTPPIGGAGMFAQGHGGLGRNATTLDEKSELLRDMFRTRGGAAGPGSDQASDAAKREYMFPSFLQQYPGSSTPSPGPGLAAGTIHGAHVSGGAFAEQQAHQKQQKKKGKKHRHANTSSSGGGGIVNLADPSILQARMQPPAGASGGQGFFGGQGQGGYNAGVMYGGGFGRW